MPEVCHNTSQNDQIGRLLSVALGFAVLGASLALPLAGDPGFERNKVFAVALGAAILLGCQRLQRVSGLGSCALLALLMSALLSLDSTRALVGSLERSQGVLLVFILAVFALAQLPWALCRFWITVAALLSSVWALMQLAGVERLVLQLSWQFAEPSRVFAGFGNPTALGGFLAMALPISAELALKSPSKSIKFLGFSACLLGIVALLATGTRAALLGLVVASALVLWRARHNQNAHISVKAVWLLLPVLLGSVLLVLTMQRSASVQHRLELWRHASAAIGHAAQGKAVLPSPFTEPFAEQFGAAPPFERGIGLRLWLGYGADMQSVPIEAAAARIDGASKSASQPERRLSDRAHNLLLDSLLEFGLIGTLLLLAWVIRKIVLIKQAPWRLCSALAGLICWQAGFPLTAEKLVFVLVLCAGREEATAEVATKFAPRVWRLAIGVVAITLATFAFGPWLNRFNQQIRTPEAAFAQFRLGSQAFKLGQFQLAVQQYSNAIKLDPWRLDLRAAKASAEIQAKRR